MKLAIAFGFAAFLGLGYYGVDHYRAAQSPEARHTEWKRAAIEPETAVRPERFEAMKWNPNDSAPVEMRAPASTKPAKSKNR